MADFTAKDVQQLRQDAGVGMMDAKQALTDAGGDIDAAFQLLRERGQAKMAKRADREANEGVVGSYIHLQSGRPVIEKPFLPTDVRDVVAALAVAPSMPEPPPSRGQGA